MFFTIYKTTNIINGKFYIGKHQTKDLNDGYMGSGKLLKRAVKKYGLDNFHKEILFVCLSETEMNIIEKILVVSDSEISYNLCQGGQGGFGYINKTAQNNKNKDYPKINAVKRGRKNPKSSETLKKAHAEGKFNYATFTGHTLSPTHKEKLNASRRGKSSWNKGVSRSEETKEKIRQSLKGKTLSEAHKMKISQGVKKFKSLDKA